MSESFDVRRIQVVAGVVREAEFGGLASPAPTRRRDNRPHPRTSDDASVGSA